MKAIVHAACVAVLVVGPLRVEAAPSSPEAIKYVVRLKVPPRSKTVLANKVSWDETWVHFHDADSVVATFAQSEIVGWWKDAAKPEPVESIDDRPPLEENALLGEVPGDTARIMGNIVRLDGYRCDSVTAARTESETDVRVACNQGSLVYAIRKVGDDAVVEAIDQRTNPTD